MFCLKCMTQLLDDAGFCPRHGNSSRVINSIGL